MGRASTCADARRAREPLGMSLWRVGVIENGRNKRVEHRLLDVERAFA